MVAAADIAAFSYANGRLAEDRALLVDVIAAVMMAGDSLRREFDDDPRPRDFTDIRRLMNANDDLSLRHLHPALEATRPEAQWAEDEDGVGFLAAGEWWVTDPVEGNINKAHGMVEFSVTTTLVRDNSPVLSVVYLPMLGGLYTAVAGGGATQNGRPLRVSDKAALDGAFVATSQNGADGDEATNRLLGRSVTAMLNRNSIVRVSPPPTLQLIQVAAGRIDVFWQCSGERAGLLAGALMIHEAGGIVTQIDGSSWTLASASICAAAPGVHRAAADVLSSVA